LLRNGALDLQWDLRLGFIEDIARGMYHLASEGIIHKDLASRNVLVTKHYEGKIADFVRMGSEEFVSLSLSLSLYLYLYLSLCLSLSLSLSLTFSFCCEKRECLVHLEVVLILVMLNKVL
jgi:serine/threonine protein kinase